MWRSVLTAVAVLATVVGVVSVAGHYWRPGSLYTLGVAALSPWLAVVGIVGIIGFALAHGRIGWIGLAVAVAVTVWQVILQAPLFVAVTTPHGRAVIVMTSNLRLGGADAGGVVEAVRGHGVELLMLEELTPDMQQRLSAAGLDDTLPYHVSDARDGGAGTGLWSRYPLTQHHSDRQLGFSWVSARASVPDAGIVSVGAVHLNGPSPSAAFPGWRYDMKVLPTKLQRFTTDHPVIVGGDFNATRDVAQFRDLLTDGYADAADQAGAGFTPTFPANRWYGPLITIDHVLGRGVVARSVGTVTIAGSDHLALVARVVVPS